MTNADGLPSPRDPDPRHLYIADDGTKTVVALLAPDVDGTAERTTLGGITTVRPHPVTRAATPHGRVETLPAEVQLSAPRSGGARIALLGSGSGVVAGGAAMYLLSPWAGLTALRPDQRDSPSRHPPSRSGPRSLRLALAARRGW
jgi:hypothetical protein